VVLNPQDFYKLIEDDLAEVELELVRQTRSNVRIIEEIGRYIQRSGGKRIRPALLLLSARVFGAAGPSCHRLAAVMELVHAATLLHDDIIDDAEVRRGRPSVNARWGNEITVLMGDWLYMTSFTLALGQREYRILDILADVTRRMVEGELIQLGLNGNLDITEEQHLDVSMRKTAHLFSACAEIGGILGAADFGQQEQLRLYGHNVGMAFQLVDDVLDLTSTETQLGKPVGSDLREGKLTLPLIYLVRDGRPEHRRLVATVLLENGFTSVRREVILDLLREYRSVERVLEKARGYAARAKESIAELPSNPAQAALSMIPDFIVERDR
jgi:octaprenyl-diphosphate synthase